MENKLCGKTIIWNGDSICQGNAKIGNCATRIAEKNSMTYKNYAVGGGTVTEGLPPTKNGSERYSVSKTIERMHDEFPNADYVIFEGGSNDADLLGDSFHGRMKTRLGSFEIADFSGEYDRTTFTGALESVFFRAIQFWAGKKIGYIIPQKMGLATDEDLKYYNRRVYFDRAVEICRKWGIPYIDLWNTCYLNPMLPDMRKQNDEETGENTLAFYIDSQHLSARGYDFTADIINSWLYTL